MSTDIEHELRELFQERAGEAPAGVPTSPAAAPQEILRRGRRHQIGTVLGSAVVVALLIGGSVAGVQALLGGSHPIEVGPPGYEIFERTATVEAFTLASPSSWFLVNEWPLSMQIAVSSTSGSDTCTADTAGNQSCTSSGVTTQAEPVPHGLPMLQLSNVDMGLNATACGQPLQADAAVLYVALDQDRASAGVVDPSLRPFPPEPGPPPEGTGPCGPGRYSRFTVNGEPFFVWIGLGSDVSEQARDTVFRTFEMMSADEGWRPSQPAHLTPGFVIAAGVGPGNVWRLELRPSEANVELSLEGVEPMESVSDFTVPEVPIESSACCTAGVLFGAVSRDAAGIAFQPTDGARQLEGTVVPLPPTMAFDFDLFFIEGTAGLDGTAIALGLENVPVSPPPVAAPRSDVVELSGSFEGQAWSVRFTGAFADGTACVVPTIAGTSMAPACAEAGTSFADTQPSLRGSATDGMYLLAGSVPPDVADLRFTSDDGTVPAADARCSTGPSGWVDPVKDVCAIALPPQGSGTLEYLDADGHVVYQEGVGWATATASASSPVSTGIPAWVQPVHGGTYWAVYPWVGPTGSPEADRVSARLFRDYGIEAFPGELACDQGAAEALGTDAPWGIGVYFDTEDDANAFALEAGLLGHASEPVVARVTTYCLD